MVILSPDAPHDVSVNLNAEGLRDDKGDPRLAEPGITSFGFDNGLNKFL
jgi:hypothetical protein